MINPEQEKLIELAGHFVLRGDPLREELLRSNLSVTHLTDFGLSEETAQKIILAKQLFVDKDRRGDNLVADVASVLDSLRTTGEWPPRIS